MARKVGRRQAPVGLLLMVAVTLVMALSFDLGAIASIGSAVALGIFALVTIAHLRVRSETGARLVPLLLALLTTGATLVVFAMTTLADDRASTLALLAIVVGSIALDAIWKRVRRARTATGSSERSPGAVAA
jgi:hypothetical protein